MQSTNARSNADAQDKHIDGEVCDVRAPSFELLSVRIDAVQIPDVIRHMEEWIRARDRAHVIAVTNIHGVTEGRRNPSFREVLIGSDLCVPDGMPLVWYGRRRGFNIPRRVYGPELLLEFCRQTQNQGYRHFFYGGAPEVVASLARKLCARFPGLTIAGIHSPPFRPLTPQEDDETVSLINASGADVIWVGLGCPKQEQWMQQHRDRLRAAVLVGVGQAFDIHAGKLRQAPTWMQNCGLEWLFRLCLEPRRLCRRYLVNIAQFVFALVADSNPRTNS